MATITLYSLNADPFGSANVTVTNSFVVDIVDDDANIEDPDSNGSIQIDVSGVPNFIGNSSNFQVFEEYTGMLNGNSVTFTLVQFSTTQYMFMRIGTVTVGDTITGTNNAPNIPTAPSTDYTSLPDFVCFASGTKISSFQSFCEVERLSPGDLILTIAGTYKPILWIGNRLISSRTLAANPKLRPVRITSGSLGNGLPVRDLLVSRQHRMLIRSGISERMFGVSEVLVPAIKLTALPGIYVDDAVEEVEYFHILLEHHEVIIAEGCATESLFTGSHAIASLDAEAREEILTIFPELADADYQPELARFVPAGKQQKRLIERHLKNNKPLQPDAQRHFVCQ